MYTSFRSFAAPKGKGGAGGGPPAVEWVEPEP